TLFASMYAAYDALSNRMKSYLQGLTAVHDAQRVYQLFNYSLGDKSTYPRAKHPVVRTHPVTGKKALYVNRGFTTRILGILEASVRSRHGSWCRVGSRPH